MKDILRGLIRKAVSQAFQTEEKLDTVCNQIEVSRTREERFGDFSTNVALVAAKKLGQKPRDVAEAVVAQLGMETGLLDHTEIAGPGFINFFLSANVWRDVLVRIHSEKESFGTLPLQGGQPILIEYVSANPTGPLHVGHGRGAAVGDSLARLLRTRGHKVETEYYVNDAGNQMRILGRSVLYRFYQLLQLRREEDFPPDHYRGDYIVEIAQELVEDPLGEALRELPEAEAVDAVSQYAGQTILDGIKEDLGSFGVKHDRYFHEKSLHDKGAITSTVGILTCRGKTEINEGATWFSMDRAQDEKDRVLIRANGEPTYFAADAAYHLDKLQRGYGRLVDIWGSDHHGYVPRVSAAIEALGYAPDMLDVLLVQFVTLIRDGKKISMSTRSGDFVTLREVLDEVGADAARFFFLTKRSDSHLDFDLDLAKRHSKDNPVYYVQYAHARVCAIFRIAAERGIPTEMADANLSLLSLPEEMKIMKQLSEYPDMLADAAAALEPHRVTVYLHELAALFHAYYHDNRVLSEEQQLRKARLFLVEAVRQVVANGLNIVGVSAPERM